MKGLTALRRRVGAGAAVLSLGLPVAAQEAANPLTAAIAGADGAALGTVTAQQTASGSVLLMLDLSGLPTGTHAVHIHETGDCGAGDFARAGGHLAGDAEHGVLTAGGSHPGDLPNIHVPDSGAVRIDYFASGLTDQMMMDADGAAFVIHADPDDYSGQPSGNAGDRIGCGVFGRAD